MKQQYDPQHDKELLILCGSTDREGKAWDIDETLLHSENSGFYLRRRILQLRKGGTWETAELGDPLLDRSAKDERRILTIHRAMTEMQVIQYVIDSCMPKKEGITKLLHKALGVVSSEINRREKTLRNQQPVSGHQPE